MGDVATLGTQGKTMSPTPTTILTSLLWSLLLTACASELSKNSDDSVADAMLSSQTDAGAVPTMAGPLFPFLQERSYEDYPAEPSAHPSAGPHGRVRSFFNQSLADSLAAGSSLHPIGSASIKELYEGSSLIGWAVMVKTEAPASASSWYFYEILSINNPSNPVADGHGVPGCANCHSAGNDFIRSSLP